MTAINANYILVEKIKEEKGEGFQTAEVQDSFVYKGRVKEVPQVPLYVDNHVLAVGDIVLFAKYSPDTHEVDGDKFIKAVDILKVL